MAEGTIAVGRTRAEHAYLELRERIIDMRLPPGAALDEEALMTEKTGWDALLCARRSSGWSRTGCSRSYPRRGTIIADVNIRDLKAISDARRVLEAFAARRAAELATDEDRVRTEGVLAVSGGGCAQELNRASIDLDEQIHRTVYAIMRNSYVEATLTQYFSLSQRMWNFVLSGMAPITGNVWASMMPC